ncbi:insulin-like peptide isoform X1 [Asterias rubens]|uniref:Insulin-like growth factor-type 1 n=2 Tax=Asterias rubens TaxID=7604 RepID=A0A0U2PX91_ASTRU|nr:insulin-like peptide isoform X1 [Asterias rubens]ALJ99972.1 insulin-like growth factor-type precursor 1 [Asterias rubens]
MFRNTSTMRALLLLDVIFVALVLPITAWPKICGEQLVETVSLVCSTRGFYSHRDSKRDVEVFQNERAAKSFLGSRIGSRQRRRTGRIATECCDRICSFDIVESYCNPWPVAIESRDPPLSPVAPGRVREDKSADVDYMYNPDVVDVEEANSVIQREEDLIDDIETQEQEIEQDEEQNMQTLPEEDAEDTDIREPEDVEESFPVPVPTKKRRKVEGRRSKESKNKGGKSEGKNKKRSGSREGGRSSRRSRGKSSRSKKQRDGRERSKRWEGLDTSHPVKEPTARSVLGRVDTRPFRNFLYNRYTVDEKRDTERESYRAVAPLTGYNSHRGGSQPDNHPTLAALYNLAVKLAKGLQH